MRSLLRDTRGSVAVTVGFTLVGLLAFTGLAIEVGEAFSLNTELQQAADASALAAAAELDGFTGAIDRATRAATAFGPNTQLWDTAGAGKVQFASIVFLSATACGSPPCVPAAGLLLPPAVSPAGDVTTTKDAEAGYVRVTTKTGNLATNLISLVSGNALLQTEAVATAGRNAIVCLDVPLMICNPNETGSGGQVPPTLVAGQEVLVSDNGGDMIAPGNWGFLCPPSDPTCGGNSLGGFLASASSTGKQCTSDIMYTKPGATTGPVKNFNARFGQTPAPSGALIAFNETSYPNDATLSANGSRISSSTTANWNSGAYMTTFHSGAQYTGSKSGPANTPTRFDVYNWENSTGVPSTTPPYSIPVYNSNGTGTIANNTARIINVGIANCIAENEQGRWHGPGIGYFQVFMTGPMASGNVYLEVIKQYNFGSGGPIHNNVALYR